MANYIPYVTKVNVFFSSRSVNAASFENCVFIAHHNLFTNRQKSYTSTSEMLTDGFADGSPAINFASGVFSGINAPDLLFIGRGAPLAYTIQVDNTAVEDDIIKVNMKLGGVATTFSYTVLAADDTPQELGDGLAALIAANGGITSAVSDVNGLITVVPVSLVTPISFGASTFTTIYTTTSETPADIMAAVRAEVDNFSAVASETHLKSDQDLYSSYAEQNVMLYGYSTSDVETYDVLVDDDIASVLQGKQYKYTIGMFSENADKEFPEGAVFGTFLSQSPSFNFTMNLQDLVGVTPSNLTSGQKSALIGKNINFYELEYGLGSFKEGFCPSGSFIDLSRFGLWLKLRGQESLYSTLKSYADRGSALPYNDIGIAIAKSRLYTDVIDVGITNGSILTGYSEGDNNKLINYNPVVETSTRASQTNTAIGTRAWEGFTVEVVYTGSIHHISVDGYVVNNRTAG